MDIEKDPQIYRGTITIGTSDANAITELMYGTVSFDFNAAGIALGALASASAAVTGLQTSSKVFIQQASADAGVNFVIQKAVCSAAGVLTVTAMNASGANKSAGAVGGYNYFALR